MANVSKNLTGQPPSAGISQSMHIGVGSPSPMIHQPGENAPTSKNFGKPLNPPVSRNFTEAAKVAKAADKVQGGATHSVFRRAW